MTVPPGAPAVLSCRTHLALHGHMSWVRIYPETGRVEELANSTEVYRQVRCSKEHMGAGLQGYLAVMPSRLAECKCARSALALSHLSIYYETACQLAL